MAISKLLSRASAVVALLVLPSFALADDISWDDGGLNKNWSNPFNWSPTGSPTGDDLSIGDLAAALGDTTLVDQDYTVNSLALSSGADADTSGNRLDVSENINVSGAGTSLIVTEHSGGPAFTTLTAEDITISASGAIVMRGGRAVLGDIIGGPANIAIVTINANSFVSGYGTLRFDENLGGVPTVTLFNDGTLQSGQPVGANPIDRYTFHIEASDANARLDLDGVFGIGVVNITEQSTLDIQVDTELFQSTMNFEAGSILELSDRLLVDEATINVNAGFAAPGVATQAIVRGHRFDFPFDPDVEDLGSQFNVNSGSFILEQGLDLHENSEVRLAANTKLVLQGSQPGLLVSNLEGELLRSGAGTELVIEDDARVNIETDSFDWDGPEDGITTINSGRLVIESSDIESGAGNSFDGTININGGRLDANIPGGWNMGGEMNLSEDQFSAKLEGVETMRVVDGGEMRVLSGLAESTTPIVFEAGANTNVSSNNGGTLRLSGNVIFEGGSTHSGDGALEFTDGLFVVDGPQTIHMPNGEVDLDASSTTSETWQLNDQLTITAQSLGTLGDNAAGTIDSLSINSPDAGLTLNTTSPNGIWFVAGQGIINIAGSGGLPISLAGSDILLQGDISITDSTQFTSRIDVGPGGRILVNTSGAQLRLSGGTNADPNRMIGGTITGSGKISSAGTTGLVGHGTVDTDVDFAGDADLIAEDGTLTVNGEILDADILGAVGPLSTLQLGAELDTAIVNSLQLGPGTFVTGEAIVNNGVTEGSGTITTTGFINNGTLRATGDGLLKLDTTDAPDIDGAGINGVIEVVDGSMFIESTPRDAFGGTATVGVGRVLGFKQNWTLGTNGTLNLNGGSTSDVFSRVAADGTSNIDGVVNVTGFVRLDGASNFGTTATVNLPGSGDTLQLLGDSTFEAGVTFTGSGKVLNLESNNLALANGFSSNALDIQNDGELQLGDGIGQATVNEFIQNTTGTLFIDIGGTGANDYDQLALLDKSAIDGLLVVNLVDGFMPSLNDSFTILGGPDPLLGAFVTQAGDLPGLNGGLGWEIEYTGTEVLLHVVGAVQLLFGDADNDLAVSGSDLLAVTNNFGNTGPADGLLLGDADDNGSVSGSDLLAVTNNFGATQAGSLASSSLSATVPEPGSISLVFSWLLVITCLGRTARA